MCLCFILRKKSPILSLSFALLGGFFYCDTTSIDVMQNRIPSALEGLPLTVTGTIVSIPEGHDQNVHFEFLLKEILKNNDEQTWRLPQKIRLAWYSPQTNKTPNLHVGETWQLSVKLKQARSTFNPASFDYEGWLFTHRISATGYVMRNADPKKISTSFWKDPTNHWRENVQIQIEQALVNDSNLGMIEALAIGVRDQLSTQQWQAMQATGTNHLVAIAGLHVGFVVSFVYFLVKFLWRRVHMLMLYLPAHEAGIIFSLFAAFYYSALAGFALPTQRALIMLSVGLLANLFRRHIPPWQALSVALMLVLLYDPLCVFSESFWLSFIAVGMILFCISDRLNFSACRFKSLRIQWVIALGLAPITLYFFHQISLINLIANAIAIPWVAFISLPLILFGVMILPLNHTLAYLAWHLAAKSLILYWPMITTLASFDRLQWHTYIPNLLSLCIAMLGCVIFLAPKGFPFRYLGLFGFLPLIYPKTENINSGEFILTQLDVGQGLSTLIQTAHHTMLFDTGPRLSADYDMGQSVVIPALEQKHIKKLDLMIISHADNDHSGGSKSVLQNLPVKMILTSVPALYAQLPDRLPTRLGTPNRFSEVLQKHWPKPQVLSCETGQHWQWDNVNFMVLSPDKNYASQKSNDRSCVIRVSNTFNSLLLTGDIEKTTEKHLLATTAPHMLKADLIIAPHHGSKSSSSEAFVNTVHPSWVFYATGYRNRFHFPHAEVVSRYNKIGTQSLDTAQDGEIILKIQSKNKTLSPIQTRKTDKHFWNFTPS